MILLFVYSQTYINVSRNLKGMPIHLSLHLPPPPPPAPTSRLDSINDQGIKALFLSRIMLSLHIGHLQWLHDIVRMPPAPPAPLPHTYVQSVSELVFTSYTCWTSRKGCACTCTCTCTCTCMFTSLHLPPHTHV